MVRTPVCLIPTTFVRRRLKAPGVGLLVTYGSDAHGTPDSRLVRIPPTTNAPGDKVGRPSCYAHRTGASPPILTSSCDSKPAASLSRHRRLPPLRWHREGCKGIFSEERAEPDGADRKHPAGGSRRALPAAFRPTRGAGSFYPAGSHDCQRTCCSPCAFDRKGTENARLL